MKILPQALKDALKAQQFIQALLVSIKVADDQFYFTSWSTDIIHNSNTYRPRGMALGEMLSSASNLVDKVSLTFDDVNREIYASLGEHDAAKFPIDLSMLILDNLGKEVVSHVLFTGIIDKWNYRPGKTVIDIVNLIFVQWARVTFNSFSTHCRWREFRGPECNYPGGESECDRTYSKCFEYDNVVNFGGFRWVSSLINKKLTI
jgi:hypothetical protein